MTLREALRRDWIESNQLTDEQFDILSQLHPDERCMRCPEILFDLPNEVEYRHGNGFVLGDGAWFDPVTYKFMYFETVYEPIGEVRFQL